MFMFIIIRCFSDNMIKPYFAAIYNLKNEINDFFCNFENFLQIFAILGVASHVRLYAINFKNYPTTHCTS